VGGSPHSLQCAPAARLPQATADRRFDPVTKEAVEVGTGRQDPLVLGVLPPAEP
jgi:hypothetical protein